jgi:hypothetical protein
MRQIKKRFKFGLLLFLALLLLPACYACGNGASVKTILSIAQGEVLIKKAGTVDWVKGEVKRTLETGDTIKSGTEADVLITFFNGSTIELKANTQIEIVELVKGKTKIIRLKQEIGETISKVEKLTDPAARYEIETPAAVAGVRGSQMLVRVALDGTTTVQNLAGQISVTAKGVEIVIPVGSASTVRQGEPPASPQPIVPELSESTNDLFDYQNNHVTGEGYQDLLGASLTKDGDVWVLTIYLNEDIPSSVDANVFMEWDLMVDSDNDAKTGWSTPLMFNDIGADYYLNFYIDGNRISAGGFLTADTAGINFTDVQYKVTGRTIELRFPPKDIGNAVQFRYIVLTRKYNNASTPSVLMGADKLPNQGHLTVTE